MHTLRLLADSKNQSRSLVDSRTRERLFWWRGSDIRLEFALADAGAFLTSGDIGTITIEIKDLHAKASDPALARHVLGAADCDASFTAADWAGGVKSLAVANFTAAETALPAGSYRLIVHHEAPSGTGGFAGAPKNTYASTEIQCLEDHLESESLEAPPVPESEYWTKDQADSRYVEAAEMDGKLDLPGTDAPSNGEPAHLVITGTLIDVDGRYLGFPKLYEATGGEWTHNGKPTQTFGYEPAVKYESGRWIAEVRENGDIIARYEAAAGAEASPHLANWSGSAVAPATGTPAVALVPETPKTPIAPYFRDANNRLWFPSGESPNHVWINSTPRVDEFIDDFSIYPDGTELGVGFQPMVGKPYIMGSGTGTPTVWGGKLMENVPGDLAGAWYLGQELSENVYNFGVEVEWERVHEDNESDQIMTFLIMPQFLWLSKLIHIRITTRLIALDFSTAGGTQGWRAVTFPNAPIRMPFDRKFTVRVRIEGDTMEIDVDGFRNKLIDPRIKQLNGRYLFFEQFGQTNSNRIRYHRAWMNAPSMDRVASQPRSSVLDELSNRYMRDPLRLPAGDTNWWGRPPAMNAKAPLLDPVSSSVAADDEALWSDNLPANSLTPLGSRWVIRANGRFAANGNTKRVRFNMTSRGPDTGEVTKNGGTWEMEIVISGSTSASHLCYGRILCSDGTVYTDQWTRNNGVATTFVLSVRGYGVAAGDVTVDQLFCDFIGAMP